MVATADAPGNSSTKIQKGTAKKRLSLTTASVFYFCQLVIEHKNSYIKLIYVLLGPVHPLASKLLKRSLLVKKLQMAVAAVTVVQPPLIRTGT